MHIMRPLFAAITLALCAPLCAQGLDVADFYGAHFTAHKDEPYSGVLAHGLKGKAPEWFDFSSSGSGLAIDNFRFHEGGMVITPTLENGSCEARVDTGIARGSLRVEIIELDIGGAFGWLLRDLGDANTAWLIELRRDAADSAQLVVRVLNRGVFRLRPEATREVEALEFPATFEVEFFADLIKASVASAQTEIKTDASSGVGVGLVATDQRARLMNLSMDIELHPTWIEDATARLLARRAIERLREHATVGMLIGIAAHPHPALQVALDAYTAEQTRAREDALAADPRARAEQLIKLADAHEKLAAAQHEAGVAALMAGDVGVGLSYLRAADKLQPARVTSLALAEALRRYGSVQDALSALATRHPEMPDALTPEAALISGRIAADRGDFLAARRGLSEAAKQFPEHWQLAALSDSVNALLEPPTLRESRLKAPFGLTLMTDLEDAQLKPLIERLGPYLEHIHRWLPGLDDELTGSIAIYASPVEYLRAALIVAGDNIDNVAGMYLRHGIGSQPTVLACRAFGEDELLRTLVHELWHLALASTGKQLPRWLDEGMAVYLSAGRLQGGVLVYNTLPSEFSVDHKELTLDQVKFAIGARPHEFYSPRRVHENYLAAWAVVWFHTRNSSLDKIRLMLTGDVAALRDAALDLENGFKEFQTALKKVK